MMQECLIRLLSMLASGTIIRTKNKKAFDHPLLLFFRSKGEAKAMFLRHEGFLGAVGSFMSSDKHGLKELLANEVVPRSPSKLSFAVDKILRSLPDGEFNGDESIECSVYAA